MATILYQGRPIDLEDPLFIRLINAETREAKTAFVERFGDLGIVGSEPDDVARFAEGLQQAADYMLNPDAPGPAAVFVETANRLIQGSRIEPRFINRAGRARLVLEAPDLAQFMLFELAAAVEAGAGSKRCEQCNKFFLHGPLTGRRAHAKYHADRCRVAAMRRRNSSKRAEK
jgi:hypothetical protein